ncbi:hypothetical protein KKC91_01980 [bacterium]|nr:hypothetical protein [bacterium]
MREKYQDVLKKSIHILAVLVVLWFGQKSLKLLSIAKQSGDVGGAIGNLLIMVFWALCLGFLLAPDFSGWLADKFFELIFPKNKGKVLKEYSRIKALTAQGYYDRAVEEYKKELDNDPMNHNLMLEIAQIYHENLKSFDLAVEYYNKALDFITDSNTWVFVKNRLADIYINNLNSKDKAAIVLNDIITKLHDTKHAQQASDRIKNL